MKLFVGLGNPGPEYSGNRHNVGFMAIDAIAEAHGFGPWKRKFQGLACEGTIAGERILLLKPQTFMNESGRSVGEAARFLKIPVAETIVFYDEIDLTPGKLKAKTGGGNAGHNGLRSISAHLGNDYQRVRIGVGHPGQKHLVANYVLANFAKSDRDWLDPMIAAIANAAPRLARGDQARFLADVAKELQSEGSGGESSGSVDSRQSPALLKGKEGGTRASKHRLQGQGAGHPAGERAAKRKGAMAENLAKWLNARKDGKH
ncbi:MAG: aminoacyl-tRNA hydrolase [Hyphomicrobiaceae bacterium]|nr:aminoacyl-tRNA hydrolase [Hyphomicrobiaceae bacterium]MCC0010364.1 aminoacyl-tRNA hydrolase [Hyphomicrobiaceae bacterium]